MTAQRTPRVSVHCVHNYKGWWVNVDIDNVPHECLGPYDFEVDIYQAMQLAATNLKMFHAKRNLSYATDGWERYSK